MNELESYKYLEDLPNLYILNISNNKLINMNFNNSTFTNLRSLDLSNNSITELGDIKEIINLKYLNLSNNQIEKIVSFEGHNKLERLILSGNKLNNINNLCDMPKLL